MVRLRVGLTGGIASGKSAVAARFADRGAVIIDADLLAREVVEPGTPGLQRIRDRFGDGVLTAAADGESPTNQTELDRAGLDRAALGRVVFADPRARRDLEAIIHPAVRQRAAELEQRAAADAVVIQVIPLLVETGQADDFDVCLVVDVDEQTQLDRLRSRDGMSVEDARRRIDAQAGRAQRLAAADLVIDNSGGLAELDRQVAVIAAGWGLAA